MLRTPKWSWSHRPLDRSKLASMSSLKMSISRIFDFRSEILIFCMFSAILFTWKLTYGTYITIVNATKWISPKVSLRRVLSVDVRTSYSTNSQYYFPLTAPRIWSPYVKGNYHFGWDEGAKTMPKSHQMTWYLYCCTTSCSFWLKSIVFGMVLRPSSQPKWYFPSSYGLHILGTVRGN